MSYAFEARFSPTEFGLSELLLRLDSCMLDSGLEFEGEIARLHSRGGAPLVTNLDTQHSTSVPSVAEQAQSWWGVSLFCVSHALADVLGRSDSIEVYLRIFKAPTSGYLLVYNESDGAFRVCMESDELTRNLAALLIRICSALRIQLAIYSEEEATVDIPNLAELERRLTQQALSPRALAWLAVISIHSMNLAQVRELAGPWKDRVLLSTADYVVLPFLAGNCAS